jgi:uncharacterized protein YecE (DUF72 family)
MVKHHLSYYASQFITAELNGVFYRTPSLDAVRGWRDQTPIYKILRRHGVALCISDHRDAPAPGLATAKHVYVRGHGPGGTKRHYSDTALRTWARAVAAWYRQRRVVYVYFDNGQKSAAPADAARLRGILRNIHKLNVW